VAPAGPVSSASIRNIAGLLVGRCRSRHLVPAAAVEEAARSALADADHSLSGPFPRRRSPLAPLPKEERATGHDALVAQRAQPVRVRRAGPDADFSGGDSPIEWLPCGSLGNDRPATAVDRAVPGKGIKIPVAGK
jgi:hypothetical protein